MNPPEDEPPSLRSYDEDGNAFDGQEQVPYNDPTNPDDPMATAGPVQNNQLFDQQQQQQQQGDEDYQSPDQEYYGTPAQGGPPDQEYYQEGDGAY